jgi:F-type H+-transporting ATPase subunit a
MAPYEWIALDCEALATEPFAPKSGSRELPCAYRLYCGLVVSVLSPCTSGGACRLVAREMLGGATMELSPDSVVYWQSSGFQLNATLVFSWCVMLVLVLGCRWVTRRLVIDGPRPKWQNVLEIVVEQIRTTIAEIWPSHPERFIPFVGTLFLYISVSSLLSLIPGFIAPTTSLSTTAALAVCVFFAVPFYGILYRGLSDYLAGYLKPTWFMLPFHIIGEISRTVALAVRLFGNMMSGAVLLGVLLVIAPLFFPVLVHLLGLLVGQIQAYIFAVLAMVYLASAAQSHENVAHSREGEQKDG